jgi:translation initiation factor 2 gamma subunit (eIF-2gamma)
MAAMLNGAAVMDAALLVIGKEKIFTRKENLFCLFENFSCE